MVLVDQWGEPLRRRLLGEELSGPTTTGVRQPWSDHPAAGLTPSRLGAILREAEAGDATSYLELAEDLEEKSFHYRAVLGTRRLQVANLPITVEARSDDERDVAIADAVRDLLDQPFVQHALFDILDAVGKGYSVCEIMWDTAGKEWQPVDLLWRDPRWFAFDRDDATTLRLRSEGGQFEPLAAFKYVRHVHRSKSGIPIRGGLARPCAWLYLFSAFGLKDWVIFGETYGRPIRLGKYHSAATEAERDVLMRALRSLGSDMAAMIPEGMVLELVEAKVSGSLDLYERLLRYLDGLVSKVILGQTMTSDDGSSLAQAQVHDEVRSDIEKDDARQLAATLRRDLVTPYVRFNWGIDAAVPVIHIGRPDEIDLAELRQSLEAYVPLGLKVGMSTIRDRLGLPDPDDDEEVLAPPQAAPAPPPERLPGDKAAANVDVERVLNGAALALAAGKPSSPGEDASGDPGASAGPVSGADAVDDDWEPMVAPIEAQLETAFREASDFADLARRLDALAETLDTAAVQEHLGRMMAMARAAGMVGADLGDD